MAARARTVVFDYGFGNVRSAERSLERLGVSAQITSDVGLAAECDALVVPGVGAFAACMRGLVGAGGVELIRDRIARGRPVLGICVGMQVLFSDGDEHGASVPGLDLWPGSVTRLVSPILPHMGWDTVRPGAGSRLFSGLEDQRFYFVHSYGVREWDESMGPADAVVTECDYGGSFVAAVEQGPLAATQFHPEKSGDAGMHLLENWLGSLEA